MAREDRPSFPWYVKDWFSSEDRPKMSYEARGVYRELLDYAWLHHGIPSDRKTLAEWLGISERKLGLLWGMFAQCWEERDGRLYNGKQERVRQEMNDFRAGRALSGRVGGIKSGEARRAKRGEPDEAEHAKQTKQNEAQLPVASEANAKQTKPSSSIAFASSKDHVPPDPTTSTPQPVQSPSRPVPLVMSPTRYAKLQESHAFVGSRLRVPHVLHDELRTKLGGVDPDQRLRAWYLELDAEAEQSGVAIPDVFEWLRPLFKEWAGEQNYARELAEIASRKVMR